MDASPPQTTYLDRLISDYGADIGIPDIAFDEENMIGLSIGGMELTLFRSDKTDGITIKALLETDEDLTKLAQPLAALNLRSFEAGIGIVGFDEEMASWVWADRFEPRHMTVSEFSERLGTAVRHIQFWAEQLAILWEDATPEQTPTDTPEGWVIRP